jgi:hypothetical protein
MKMTKEIPMKRKNMFLTASTKDNAQAKEKTA